MTRDSSCAANGDKVCVVNSIGSTVSVIDTLTDAATATIAVGGNPRAIAITP